MSLRERTRPSLGIIEPCLPSPAKAPPTGPGWLHEIKHDGFRIQARRCDGRAVDYSRGAYVSDPARVQGLSPSKTAARAAHEGLLHRRKLLIVPLLLAVLKAPAVGVTRQLAQYLLH
jgi:hypothetical protein